MARAAFRSGICPVTTAYHRGVVTGDDTRYDDLRTWSVDRLRSEQTARLRETVQAAYASVPHYRTAFDAVGLHPRDVRSLDDLARVPFTTKEDLRQQYPFGMFAVPREEVVRVHASSGHDRPAHRRGVHAGRSRRVVGGHGEVDPRGRWPSWRHRPRGLRVRAVHRRSGSALRRRAARLHRGAGLGRDDRAPGPAHPRLRAAGHHGHAQLLPQHSRRDGATRPRPQGSPRCGSGSSEPNRGPSRCAARSRSARPWTPSTSTACPR